MIELLISFALSIFQKMSLKTVGIVVVVGLLLFYVWDAEKQKESYTKLQINFDDTVEAYESQLKTDALKIEEKAITKEQKKVVVKKHKKLKKAIKERGKIDEKNINDDFILISI